jgi:phosphatidylinositol alpha-mannosyltransferase
MRVALLHPTYWPEVRRGAERLVHDLAAWLARAGHDVTILTTHRASTSTAHEDGVRVVRAWRPPDVLFERRSYERYLGSAPGQMRELFCDRYDVVQAFFPVSGWVALKARRHGGAPVVYSHMGIPDRGHLVSRRHRLSMHVELARGATACTVLSEAAARPFRRYLLRDPEVIPPGVACDDFEIESPRAEQPTIVYSGSPGDPRKRVDLLLDAFVALRGRRPDARLHLAGRREPGLEMALPDGAAWVPGDRTPELAQALAAAHVAVLPSLGEAFGLVLAEALAAGTPVVATNSGGPSEIVTPDVGKLFEPGDRDSLVAALDQALDMNGTRERYRAHARQWDWGAVGPRYEALLARAAEDS